MKTFMAVATALLLLGAAPALAQGYQGKSDDYVCNHGDPADPATAEACARLRGPGAAPAAGNPSTDEAPAASSTPTLTAAATSAPFRQGQSDRQRYDAWQSGLSGDPRAGATWGAAHRSEGSPSPCAGAGSATTGPGWSQGCLAAQRQLANFDRLRKSSPDYRQGWNHPTSTAPETVASAAAPVAAAPTPSTDVEESPLGSGAGKDSDANPAADNADDQGSAEVSIDSSHWPWRWLHALGAMAIVAVVIGLFSGLAIYFIPTLIAVGRHKRNAAAIFALNLFLGWSFIGWVVALIWSLAHDTPPRK